MQNSACCGSEPCAGSAHRAGCRQHESNQKSISLKRPHGSDELTPEIKRRRQMEIERRFSVVLPLISSGVDNMEADASTFYSNIVSTMTSTPKSSKRRRIYKANQKSISLKSPDESDELTPEIKRRRQMEIERRLSMFPVIASGAENMEVANASISDSNIVSTITSAPKSSKRHRSKIINKYKSRLVPYSSSSSRRSLTAELKSKRHIASQTTFSDDEPDDLKEVWNNFFVGTPTIYNICSCRNHVCRN